MPTILYERTLPHGPAVRIRLTSSPGDTPATAVLEIERRTSMVLKHASGTPPRLAEATSESAEGALEILRTFATDDEALARLMSEVGLG